MRRGALVGLVLLGALGAFGGCRHVDERVLTLRLDELATVVSEAETPGPRSPEQIAAIESQGVVLKVYMKGLAQ